MLIILRRLPVLVREVQEIVPHVFLCSSIIYKQRTWENIWQYIAPLHIATIIPYVYLEKCNNFLRLSSMWSQLTGYNLLPSRAEWVVLPWKDRMWIVTLYTLYMSVVVQVVLLKGIQKAFLRWWSLSWRTFSREDTLLEKAQILANNSMNAYKAPLL